MPASFRAMLRLKKPPESWADNVLRFSFNAKKGFFGTTISGVIQVNDASLLWTLNCQDWLLRLFPKIKFGT